MFIEKVATRYRMNMKFKQYRKSNKDWISDRFLLVEPFRWNSGYAINLHIMEEYSNEKQPNVKQARLDTLTYYDKECGNSAISTLLGALVGDEMRGQTAENAIFQIVMYFMYNDGLEILFPDEYKYREEQSEEYKGIYGTLEKYKPYMQEYIDNSQYRHWRF
jgi:hypothetical protein